MKVLLGLTSFVMVTGCLFSQERPDESIVANRSEKVSHNPKESKGKPQKAVDASIACEVSKRFKELGAPSFKARRAASKRLLEIAMTMVSPKAKTRKNLAKVEETAPVDANDGEIIEVEVVEPIEILVGDEPMEAKSPYEGAFEQDPSVASAEDIPNAWHRQFPNMQTVVSHAETLVACDDPEVSIRAREILKECNSLKKAFHNAHVKNLW